MFILLCKNKDWMPQVTLRDEDNKIEIFGIFILWSSS